MISLYQTLFSDKSKCFKKEQFFECMKISNVMTNKAELISAFNGFYVHCVYFYDNQRQQTTTKTDILM